MLRKILAKMNKMRSSVESARYISEHFQNYHRNIILELHKNISLREKRILDVGGCNIPAEFMKSLGVKQFVCMDPISKWWSFHAGGGQYVQIPEMLNGKKVYSRGDITPSRLDEFSFILDDDIENINQLFFNYFDIIISISTFEHVTDLRRSLDNIYRYLRTGGVLHSQYEPIFSSPVGHHLYIDEDLNFSSFTIYKR